MPYQISYATSRKIAEHARSSYPQEACGLIAGTDKCISRAHPLSNVADEPEVAFALEPNEQLKALKMLDAAKLNWIGVYHSHPKTRPIPSAVDISETSDVALLHLIVSLRSSKPAFQLWQVRDQSVDPLELYFESEPRQAIAEPALSQQQKIAIVMAGAIGLVLMLAVAFSLLPPAPVILPVP